MVHQSRIAEEFLNHDFDKHCLEDISVLKVVLVKIHLGPFLPKWGGTRPWALRCLVVKEIDCGDWLAKDTCQPTSIVNFRLRLLTV